MRRFLKIVAICFSSLLLVTILAFVYYLYSQLRRGQEHIRTYVMLDLEFGLNEYKSDKGANPARLIEACRYPYCKWEAQVGGHDVGVSFGCPFGYGPFVYRKGKDVPGDWSFVANWGRNGRWEVSSSGDVPEYQDESKVPSGDDLVLRDSAHGWRLISSLPKVPNWVSLRDTDKVQILSKKA